MLKPFVILIAVVGAVILLLARLRPDSFRVERSTTIQAPPEKVFPYISDLRNWAAWSAWEKMDPDMKKTYSVNSSGQGASYEWEGNKKVGHGRMTIARSVSPHRIVLDLDFLAPISAHNKAELTLQARENGTRVTWAMYGPAPFLYKLTSLFVSMDKMVGKDFEDSLASLKAVAER